jgi:hypothetical protein
MNRFKKRYLISVVLLVSMIAFRTPASAEDYIAGYSKAKESVLRNIPVQYINASDLSQDVYHYETDAYKPTESGNDNVQHKEYFDSHTQGVHWFAARDYSSGTVKWPAHCAGTPQHITSNRRAYAAWWIWA